MFGTPGAAAAAAGSPLSKSDLGRSLGGYSPKQHSPMGKSVSINSQGAIDRLLED